MSPSCEFVVRPHLAIYLFYLIQVVFMTPISWLFCGLILSVYIAKANAMLNVECECGTPSKRGCLALLENTPSIGLMYEELRCLGMYGWMGWDARDCQGRIGRINRYFRLFFSGSEQGRKGKNEKKQIQTYLPSHLTGSILSLHLSVFAFLMFHFDVF